MSFIYCCNTLRPRPTGFTQQRLCLTILRVEPWDRAQLNDFSSSPGLECGSDVVFRWWQGWSKTAFLTPGALADMNGRLGTPVPSPSPHILRAALPGLSCRVVRLHGSCPSSYRPGLELPQRHSTLLPCSKQAEATLDSRGGKIHSHFSLRGGSKEFVAAFNPPERIKQMTLYI